MSKSQSVLRSAYQSLIQRKRLLPDEHQLGLIDRLASLQDELLATNGFRAPQVRGLYIFGSVGTGKTRVVDLFSETLPSSISKRRVHFNEFMMDVHQRLHTARSALTYSGDPLVQIGRDIRQESRILCFDEFQVTDIADAMILGRLFGSIWHAGGVMVSTSNRHPDNLYENGLNRVSVEPFFCELQRRCEIWQIGGKQDYRMRDISSGAETGKLETFFVEQAKYNTALIGYLEGRKLQDISVPVFGSRKLLIRATCAENRSESIGKKAHDVVSAKFEDICEQPLSSIDYHALCRATKTLFIAGLRQFGELEKDVVRRFITLIDLAYELKTRVICLSTVPLGEVFINMIPKQDQALKKRIINMSVKGQGGASSSMMSTYIDDVEWSATGLIKASLATGGAGETDVGFAITRTISRVHEMSSMEYGIRD